MKELIIIRYGELSTKKDNKNFFLKTLKKNIEDVLLGLNYSISYSSARMFIFGDNLDEIRNRLKYVFGIREILMGYEYESTDLENIKKELKLLLANKKITTFKVVTTRSNKSYPIKSPELSGILGAEVLKTKESSKVDIHNPDLVIHIEIRDKLYIYFDKTQGLNGYPVGVQGKGLLMLSGGIDSPVAGYLAMKRGIRIEAIYFESPPHTSLDAKEKVKTLTRILSKYSGFIKLHIIPFTEIQETILKTVPHDYMITIMRRMMYRISERIANKNNAKVIINGESIGQVASQTLTSLSVINRVVSMPVIRPVACLDKLEIIDIAKNIKTYETSILPYEDCCTIFVPTHPVINPSLEKCILYEENFDYEKLIKEACVNEEVITITKENKNFEDLL